MCNRKCVTVTECHKIITRVGCGAIKIVRRGSHMSSCARVNIPIRDRWVHMTFSLKGLSKVNLWNGRLGSKGIEIRTSISIMTIFATQLTVWGTTTTSTTTKLACPRVIDSTSTTRVIGRVLGSEGNLRCRRSM